MRPPRAFFAVLLVAAITPFPSLISAQTTETLADGLIIEHTSGPVICDRPTRSHDRISVHYKGTLQSDGSEFDSSYNRNAPFVFVLDAGRVIKGWDEGLQGMCIGQSRKLVIPPELGYGARGSGPIPGGATLVFETKLLGIVGYSNEPAPTTSTSSGGTGGQLSIATAPPVPQEKPAGAPDSDSEELSNKEGLLDTPSPHDAAAMDDPSEQARCHLLGPFALIVQGALGAFALLTLVVKRWREPNKRPWKIFFFDVSKQVFGSMLTHVINLAMSMLGSGGMANAAAHVANAAEGAPGGRSPNPCSFYLLNLGIDVCDLSLPLGPLY